MVDVKPCFRPDGAGTLLFVKVLPRAAKNQVCGIMGDVLKIKVTAPPVDSAANEAVCRFIAELLGCSTSAIRVVRGATSRNKVVSIQGFRPPAVARCLCPEEE